MAGVAHSATLKTLETLRICLAVRFFFFLFFFSNWLASDRTCSVPVSTKPQEITPYPKVQPKFSKWQMALI